MRNWFIKFKISKYGVSSWVTQVGSNIFSNISSRSFAARKKNKKTKKLPKCQIRDCFWGLNKRAGEVIFIHLHENGKQPNINTTSLHVFVALERDGSWSPLQKPQRSAQISISQGDKAGILRSCQLKTFNVF